MELEDKSSKDADNIQRKVQSTQPEISAARKLGQAMQELEGLESGLKRELALISSKEFSSDVNNYTHYMAGTLEVAGIEQKIPARIKYNGQEIDKTLPEFLSTVLMPMIREAASDKKSKKEQEAVFLMREITNYLAKAKYSQRTLPQNTILEIDSKNQSVKNSDPRQVNPAPAKISRQASTVNLEAATSQNSEETRGQASLKSKAAIAGDKTKEEPSEIEESGIFNIAPQEIESQRSSILSNNAELVNYISPQEEDQEVLDNSQIFDASSRFTIKPEEEQVIPKIPSEAECSILEWAEMSLGDLKRVFPQNLMQRYFYHPEDQKIRDFDYQSLQMDINDLASAIQGPGSRAKWSLSRLALGQERIVTSLISRIKKFDSLIRSKSANYQNTDKEKLSRLRQAAVLVALDQHIDKSWVLLGPRVNSEAQETVVTENPNPLPPAFLDIPQVSPFSTQAPFNPIEDQTYIIDSVLSGEVNSNELEKPLQTLELIKSIRELDKLIKKAKSSKTPVKATIRQEPINKHRDINSIRKAEGLPELIKKKSLFSPGKDSLPYKVSFEDKAYSSIPELKDAINYALVENQKMNTTREVIGYSAACSIAKLDFINKKVEEDKANNVLYFQKGHYEQYLEPILEELKDLSQDPEIRDLKALYWLLVYKSTITVNENPQEPNKVTISIPRQIIDQIQNNFDRYKNDIIKLAGIKNGYWAKAFEKVGILDKLAEYLKNELAEKTMVSQVAPDGSWQVSFANPDTRAINETVLLDELEQCQKAYQETMLTHQPNPFFEKLRNQIYIKDNVIIVNLSAQDMQEIRYGDDIQRILRDRKHWNLLLDNISESILAQGQKLVQQSKKTIYDALNCKFGAEVNYDQERNLTIQISRSPYLKFENTKLAAAVKQELLDAVSRTWQINDKHYQVLNKLCSNIQASDSHFEIKLSPADQKLINSSPILQKLIKDKTKVWAFALSQAGLI